MQQLAVANLSLANCFFALGQKNNSLGGEK